MGERVRGRRVGEVVGRHVDRLHGGDRAGARRGDALLQLPHLGRERRLVADGARHAPEQRGDLRACLDEAEDVVDEEEHVLALLAEVLGHRQARERDAQAGAGRLVHLAVDERDLVEHARLLHLEVEVVALAGALADAGEDRDAACAFATLWISSMIVTVLPTPAPPKRPTLPPLMYGAIRSMTLIPVSKTSTDGFRSRKAGGSRWIDHRSTPGIAGFSSTGWPITFQMRPSVGIADGNRDRAAGVDDVGTARETVGGVHRDRAHAVVAEVLLHLRDERRGRAVGLVDLDLDGVEDLGQAVGEDRVDHDAFDLDDLAGVDTALAGHGSPGRGISWCERGRPSRESRRRASAAILPERTRS